MSDPSLPALPVSNVCFHSSRLPGDWFSMKPKLLLVPELRLQTLMCLLGLPTYLLSSFSSPLLLFPSLFIPLFKSSQASLSSPAFSFQVETGGSKKPGSFPFLYVLFLVSFLLGRSLSISVFFQIELKEVLDLPFWRREVRFSWNTYKHKNKALWMQSAVWRSTNKNYYISQPDSNTWTVWHANILPQTWLIFRDALYYLNGIGIGRY